MPELAYPSLPTTIFAFLLVLGPLVLIHELGHYLVGRWFGVKAEAFSIGFGKELIGRTDKRGTRWKLSALPLGGYVQFKGDMNAAGLPDDSVATMSPAERAQTFQSKALWQRALIVLAGPLTNFLCAVLIFSVFNMVYGRIVATPLVAQVQAGSSAAAAGVRAGDLIVSLDGKPINDFNQVATRIGPYPGERVTMVVQRGGRDIPIALRIATVVDRDSFGNEGKIGRIGVMARNAAVVPVGPLAAVALGTRQTVDVMGLMVTGIRQIFTGQRSVKELGGPIAIAKLSGEQLSLGWPQFVIFAALISINLAFINLLPIPGLDGGHVAFYAAEAIRRKPLGPRTQLWAFRTGMGLVLTLMLVVTIGDIAKLSVFS